jgi:chromosomal replication initiator protein
MDQSANKVWTDCLIDVKSKVSVNAFNRWFKPIKAILLKGNDLTIQVPNPFFFEYLEEHYMDELRDAITHVMGKEGKLKYQILMADSRKGRRDENRVTDFTPGTYSTDVIKNPFVVPGIKKMNIEHNLVDKYNFENYIEGDCNKLARSAGINIAGKPGKTSFNPFVIYGGVGLGKTHLIQAIGNEIIHNDSNKRVLYVSSEKFTNQIIQSIKNRATEELVAFYQELDVLIVDDIQFFAGRGKTKEIFFHIFNHLHNSGGQIILSSDRAPKDLDGLEDRLISRFKWGLTADLRAPEYETRMAILMHKLELHGIELSLEGMHYICLNIDSNIRELEGVVISLLAQTRLNGQELTMPVVKKAVTSFINGGRREITVENIQEMVAEHYAMPLDRILSRSRARDVVVARQLSMFLSKKMTKETYKHIGTCFGGKDHTTVMYAIKTIKNLLDTDDEFHSEVQALEKRIEMSLS